MYSIKDLYKIGNGPSSSHTMGPKKATLIFNERFSEANSAKVILYGSLALTGKGHLTDKVILDTIFCACDIEFDYLSDVPHPNTLDFIAYKKGVEIGKMRVYSVGGGSIQVDGETFKEKDIKYKINTLGLIKRYINKNNIDLYDFVIEHEDKDFLEYMGKIYDQMLATISSGLSKTNVIQGKLGITRKANILYNKQVKESNDERDLRHLYAYAYAASEENADGGIIVTSPTCGSCGIVPAVLRYSIEHDKISRELAIKGLCVAGLIGNIVKENGSISGAEAGCQAEVGTACSMAAAYYAYVLGYDENVIDQASEIALEHHLGLTCDPILGYVQIPCIERNAVAAIRAINATKLATLLDSSEQKISFDMVVMTMLETGRDIQNKYRETSQGGLAKYYSGE